MDLITQLAIDLDAFLYDYDTYGYMDAFDDRDLAVHNLELDLFSGRNIDGLLEYLKEIVNDQDEEWAYKAKTLIDQIKLLVDGGDTGIV